MDKSLPIRVLIVDDHAVVRSGLRQFSLAYDDLEVVGEAGGGAEAVALCSQTKPDVVLMDLVMPDMDGSQATRLILEDFPQVKVIILTSFHEQDLIEQALKAGAISYMLKNTSAKELAQAIRAAHDGRSILAPEALDTLIQATRSKSSLGNNLSDREREVLILLAEGLTNPQIAERLSISLATVKYHVRNILTKLGATNRGEAISLAWQHHLIK